MIQVSSEKALREALAGARLQGKSIGFVPTMGALHAGHASLLKVSREQNQVSVLSIYVNPTQFGPKEDLAQYPRTLEADLAVARDQAVDIVFTPENSVIYPTGFSSFVEVGAVAEPLCGVFRPGHFRGVATIVTKLFQLVQPTRAYFGQKDLQQCLVIERLVKDLNIPIEICIEPTLREADGLAMSSRNRFLDADERSKAPILYQALQYAKCLWEKGELDVQKIVAETRQYIDAAGVFTIQYLEIRSLPDLRAVTRIEGPAAFAVAAYLGKTRLIDNIVFSGQAKSSSN